MLLQESLSHYLLRCIWNDKSLVFRQTLRGVVVIPCITYLVYIYIYIFFSWQADIFRLVFFIESWKQLLLQSEKGRNLHKPWLFFLGLPSSEFFFPRFSDNETNILTSTLCTSYCTLALAFNLLYISCLTCFPMCTSHIMKHLY